MLLPLLDSMIATVPTLSNLSPENFARAKLMPELMQGHYRELDKAAQEQDLPKSLAEIREINANTDEFLKLMDLAQ